MGLTLRFHDEELSMCLLEPGTPAPATILAQPLTSFMRTQDETTLICPTRLVPSYIKIESGWIALEFVGPFPFDATGILTQVATPLAQAGIAIIALATFATDYVLIKADKREDATAALQAAGHTIL